VRPIIKFTSLSIIVFGFLSLFFFKLYSLTAYSVLLIIGANRTKMHSVSLDVVRKALATLKCISLCTLIYFCLLYAYFIASIQTGAPYSRKGSTAPLYIVFIASCLSPQDI